MKKRIIALMLLLVLMASMTYCAFVFFDFVSQTIYEESTAHLTEIFHQANQTLYNMVSINWSRMRMWAPYLQEIQDDDQIAAYVDSAREESNFTDFFFISRNGNYLSMDGQKGYLDLGKGLYQLILDRQPVVANSVVPDKPEIMVFAVPTAKSSFHGFDYEAIAITFNNSDMVEALKISAFDGHASTFAVLPDGRVMVNNGSEEMRGIHNVLALLETDAGFTDQQISELRQRFKAGESGNLGFNVDTKSYYLVYEPANFQDWMVLGIVPMDVVNFSMSRLQSTTMLVVGGISVVLMMVVLMLVVVQNQQKLRRKDTQLLSRDELFSKLSANVDDVFLMLDAKNLRVDYVSPNIRRLMGLSDDQVREKVHIMEQLVSGEDKHLVLSHLSDILPGQQLEWDREYIHHETQELRWFHVIAFCSEVQGEKKYILDLSDRTKEKRINQELEDAVHTAESACRAKTIFLNNMSHDIRTPMNAIIGFTNIAYKHEPKPEVLNCLNKISESSEHLLTLINDVLDISRIESGKIHFLPVPSDLREITSTVLSIVQGFLSNRDVTFRTELQELEHPYVLADAVRIREVLVNILGNAVKFTPDGGTITLETSSIPLDKTHIRMRYRISDTGVGMSQDFLCHIFDEFSQEESSARTQYKGTGLGMAITKRYVDLMGGTVQVESEKGKGSTFTVELPLELTEEQNIQKPDSAPKHVDIQGIRILLAEDNDLNAEIATVQLEELGLQITRATNGEEAVSLFQQNPPGTFDLIFMDVMMPQMNGYQATAAIRSMKERPDARRIPIIAMTANAFAEDVQASLDAGMNSHLSKPIVMDEVIKAIVRNVNQ